MSAQPRENAVPCRSCGIDRLTRRPRRTTWNPSGLCDEHEISQGTRRSGIAPDCPGTDATPLAVGGQHAPPPARGVLAENAP